jgi:hypothetical protein
MWGSHRLDAINDCLPITTAPGRKKLCPLWTTIQLALLPDIATRHASDENTRRELACERNSLALARAWAAWCWLRGDDDRLTVVRLRMVPTAAIVERDTFLALRGMPQIQVTVSMIISVRLIVSGAAQPPRGTVSSPPCIFALSLLLLPEFIGFAVHPPHPFFGRVTSTIQCGFLRGDAEAIKVFQSFALLGEKSLVPSGQLFAS